MTIQTIEAQRRRFLDGFLDIALCLEM